jgi:hypothetical protein
MKGLAFLQIGKLGVIEHSVSPLPIAAAVESVEA